MASPIRVNQGSDLTLSISHNDSDLASATEIAFRVGTPSAIEKTLTGGGISGVTASVFVVQIDAADTADIVSGRYPIEARSTKAGIVTTCRLNPSEIQIIDSLFSDTE